MMTKLIIGFVLFATAFAQQCNDAKLTDIKTITTKDTHLNTETSYVVQFKANCAGNAKNVQFFTQLDGKYLSSSVDETGQTYQISWSEPNAKARTGEIKLNVYDEEGFGAYKKALRANLDPSKVKILTTITFYHSTGFRGISFQSEFFVTTLFGSIFYWAYVNKSNLQA